MNHDDLIHRFLDGIATAEGVASLSRLIETDVAVRARYLDLAGLHAALMADETLRSPFPGHRDHPPKIKRRFTWRPLAAAAAGLAIGCFSASVLFAYVGPSTGNVVTLLQEDFESEPAPLVNGVPIEAGKWSGDFTEVSGVQQEVKPDSGAKMLRFLRGDFEGRSIPSSHSSDVFRLVDVRPYRSEFADGGAVVQLSAVFNAVAFSEDEKFSATLTLFALDASLVGNEMLKEENVLSTESLAFSRSSKVSMDRNPVTWQRVSNELRLPPGTEFLMLRLGMSNDTKSSGNRRDSFAGHYADKVQLVLARRPEIPLP